MVFVRVQRRRLIDEKKLTFDRRDREEKKKRKGRKTEQKRNEFFG